MKKLDLKSILTILVVLSLIGFVALILFKIKITTEIATMFISAFILFADRMANYYFNRKSKDEAPAEEKKEGE